MKKDFSHRKFSVVSPSQPTDFYHSSNQNTTIVVPCYNEAERLSPDAYLHYLNTTFDVNFVFVDDGSCDATLEVLSDLHCRRPDRIEVLQLTRNCGKAEAVRQGLLHAIDRGADLVGYWDADLATPLDSISEFRHVTTRFDQIEVVFGSRRMLLGHKICRTFCRRTISLICAQLARLAVRLPIGDTQCGAKLFRNTHSLRTALGEPFSAGWLFDVELFARISQNIAEVDRAFYEHPLAEWTEIPGSKVSARAIIKSAFQMLRLITSCRLGFSRATAKVSAAGVRHIHLAGTDRIAA